MTMPETTPTFEQYVDGLEDFLTQSADWHDLDDRCFYTVSAYGFEETCDNANGGLDCSWAFRARERGEEITEARIRQRYEQELEALREVLQEE